VQITSSLATVKTPTLVALGNFDGIHRGHRQVLQPILSPSARSGTQAVSTVVTFKPHPQEFFTGQSRALLTPLDEKASYLEALGVGQLVLLPFDDALACLSPQEFVEKIVVQQLQAQHISVGQNFRFGHRRAGTTADLKTIAAQHQIAVTLAPLYTTDGERDPRQANQLLGRPYALIGEVVKGQQLGRTIGFPTANLRLPPDKFLPRNGVYRVQVAGVGLGVMNVGDRPTVDGKQRTIEVHVLDWAGDLYGQVLTVQVERFLRSEQRFESLEALQAQIERDCAVARQNG
jgi:riboflavin kinase / FMN adenylyltransferase